VADALTGPGMCGTGTPIAAEAGRCGYAERQPLVVISPWAKSNYVDHTLTDQSSILRFIEDNWLGGTRLGAGSFDAIAGSINGMFDFGGSPNAGKFRLNETTGEPNG